MTSTFSKELSALNISELASVSLISTDADVTRALMRAAGERDLWDLAALLSPSASEAIEENDASSVMSSAESSFENVGVTIVTPIRGSSGRGTR